MGKFQTHNMFKKISINTVASVEYLPRFETLTGYTAWPVGPINKPLTFLEST